MDGRLVASVFVTPSLDDMGPNSVLGSEDRRCDIHVRHLIKPANLPGRIEIDVFFLIKGAGRPMIPFHLVCNGLGFLSSTLP